MINKTLYEELTPKEFNDRITSSPIAYLPLGTLEWHGEHLPLGSDGIQSQGFFKQLASKVGGVVLPTLFLGPDRMVVDNEHELYGMDICYAKPGSYDYYESQKLPGSAYWVSDDGFKGILEVVLKQIARAGFKIVVAHGHGPSTLLFSKLKEEWKSKYGLMTFDCWGSEYDDEGLGLQSDHAAMNETSIVMALRPDLVQMDNLSTNTDEYPVGIAGKDPRVYASSEIGNKIIELQVEHMSTILKNALESLKK
ncbi:MAG TPA: creatininase family protein [Ruminiclostridium sp.]